jgi:ice-binding like protein
MNRTKSFLKPLAWFTAILLAALVAGCGGQQTAGQINAGATAPRLGTEQAFAVLGGSAVTNTGPSVITGNVGVSPKTGVGGFPPGILTGVIHSADGVALQAQTDTTTTYNNLAGQVCDKTISADLGGTTLAPGVYCSASSMGLTGALTLDAGGNPNAAWVFQAESTLITASNSSVVLINGANPCNVFWQVGSSATLGTTTAFVGNIFALTSISLNSGASVSGRVLARNGAVTLDTNVVTVPTCNVPPTSIPPTLGKSFSPGSINAGAVSTLTITLSNANGTPANLSGPLIDNLPPGLMVVPGTVKTTCIETKLASGWFIEVPGKVGLTAEGLIPANGSCTVTADVTAAAGTYVNALPPGALQTDHGNNAEAAVATLTVL